MQPHSSSFRIGGPVLVVAGLLAALGAILHGPQPGTLDALAGAGGMWTVSHVLIALAGALFAAGSLYLGRSFAGGSAEGWGVLGMAAGVLAGVCTLAVGAIETVGFSSLLAAGQDGGIAAEHAFVAASSTMAAFAGWGAILFTSAVGVFGIAMLTTDTWPGWLGWAGIVVGFGLLLLDVINVGLPGPYTEIVLTGLWVVGAGVLFMNMGRPAPEPAPAPARTVGV